MKQYIPKSALVAEIERRKDICEKVILDLRTEENKDYYQGKAEAYKETLSLLDTIEVKEVGTWHLQEKEDVYDAIKDWGLHTFACIMKDGTIQKFSGVRGEDNVYIDGANVDYDNVDDIVKWIEYT